ncbi:MAG: hypothetical protein RR527_08590, partial [Clostridia bacterium]
HSDFSTTANIYAHLDFNSKVTSAQAMLNGLEMNGAKPTADLEPAQNQAGVNSIKRRELALASNPLS